MSNKNWDSSCPSPGGSNPKPPTLSGDLPSGLLSLYSPPPTPTTTTKKKLKETTLLMQRCSSGRQRGFHLHHHSTHPPNPPLPPHGPPPTPRHSPSQAWLRENSLTYLKDPYQGGWGPDRLGEVGEEAGFLRGWGGRSSWAVQPPPPGPQAAEKWPDWEEEERGSIPTPTACPSRSCPAEATGPTGSSRGRVPPRPGTPEGGPPHLSPRRLSRAHWSRRVPAEGSKP